MDIFSFVAESSVNPQDGYFYLDFRTETEQCESLWISTKTDKFVSGAVQTQP